MNLYLLDAGPPEYEQFNAIVVCAESEEAAMKIHPTEKPRPSDEISQSYWDGQWPIDKVKIEFLGVAAPNVKPGVIVASFNAG